MVVLGGWYLYQCDEAVNPEPRLCQIVTTRNGFAGVYWAEIGSLGYAGLEHLTPVPHGLNQILSDSIKYGETKWQN